MQPTTLGHLRDAATAFTSAQASLGVAQEELQATLADFNAKDGQVAEAVAEAGGTLASREILVASGEAFVANPAEGCKEISVNDPIAASDDPDATATVGPADATRAKDPLRVADTMVLRDGETFAGSASARGDEGLMALAAAVDTPHGRVVHVAVPVHEEGRADWKGAHAPDQESRVDPEEGNTYEVDTYSDVTTVIGVDDVVELPARVDDVITMAARIDREYRQLIKQSDRLYDERMQLEMARFGGVAEADLQLRLDSSEKHHHTYQQKRRTYMQDCVDALGADDRARYDALQRRIAAAGTDWFEPDREGSTGRLVVRRVLDANTQDPLFPVWRYHPFFTNNPEPATDADITHRRHAICETVEGQRLHLSGKRHGGRDGLLPVAGAPYSLASCRPIRPPPFLSCGRSPPPVVDRLCCCSICLIRQR